MDMNLKSEVILNNNLSYSLCIDTNFVINAQVFSYFVGIGAEKCPFLWRDVVCDKRLY